MSKNIVVCCDGTANQFARDKTNVLKLFMTLHQDPAAQVVYYHPGLGTMEAAGALTTFSRRWTKLLGMAIGYGLADDIRDAYVFLMHCYQPGDSLFMFGFSRGAYTVRAVASLLHMYGLLPVGNEPMVPYAIRMMTAINRGRAGSEHKAEVDEYFELADEFKAVLGRIECKPWFVGVWDTVSSVGWIENPLKLPFTADNPDIAIGRHAVSIDERRAFFRSHLWRPSPALKEHGPRDVKQVWFPGVHSDVGGGYPEAESGLSKIALEWMLDQAEASGLQVDPAKRREILGGAGGAYVRPDPTAKMHESLTGWWNLAEFIPKKHFDYATGEERRRPNLYRRRTIPPPWLVHESAFERGDEYVKRLPPQAVRIGRRGAGVV